MCVKKWDETDFVIVYVFNEKNSVSGLEVVACELLNTIENNLYHKGFQISSHTRIIL